MKTIGARVVFALTIFLTIYIIFYAYLVWIVNIEAKKIAHSDDFCWVIPMKTEFPSYITHEGGNIFYPSIFDAIMISIFTERGKRPVHFGLYMLRGAKYSDAYFYRWEYSASSFVGGPIVFGNPLGNAGPGDYDCIERLK